MTSDTIGKRIKETRLRLGLIQDEVSEAAGLSKGFYSDVENDKGSMSIDSLVRIADALGVSVEWLRCFPGPERLEAL